MNLLKSLLDTVGSGGLEKLGGQFGLDSGAVESVMGQVIPALGKGMRNNTRSTEGLEGLIGALKNGNHRRYLDDVSSATTDQGIEEGNGILGHILGSKDVSRNLAAHASSASGVSSDVIKKMLPMLAAMAMGSLSKQSNGGEQLQRGGQGDDQRGGLLESLLDSDNDGGVIDDVLDLAKRFF